MTTTRQIGNVLEDIVAMLHDVPAASVQTRVKIPAVRPGPDGERTREIDVLISQDVAGYPVQIPIECKNEQDKIGVEYIDAFVGKLADVGIHPRLGIFVSPIGYTADARARAQECGLRLLVLEGLDRKRLAAAINDALLSIVLDVLFVETISEFAFLPPGYDGEAWPDGLALNPANVHSVVWQRWITGALPNTLGEQTIFFRDRANSRGAIVQCRIVAYTGSVRGIARKLTLKNVASSQVERSRLETEFKMPNTVDLQPLRTDEELAQLQNAAASECEVVVKRIRVPRIIAGPVFWPPSREAVQRVLDLQAKGVAVTFAMIEGRNLSAAWTVFETRRKEP